MFATMGDEWMWLVAGGLMSAIAGVIMLSWPEATLRVVAIIIGLQLLVAGVLGLIGSLSRNEAGTDGRALAAVLSGLAIVAGVLCLKHQLETVGLLGLILGAYWLVFGCLSLYGAVADQTGRHRWLRAGLGALFLIAGIVVLSAPVNSAIALARLLGIWLIVTGAFEALVAIALRTRRRRFGSTG
jgi:uncharacterized membrane protein HdeD (DUF308 family)